MTNDGKRSWCVGQLGARFFCAAQAVASAASLALAKWTPAFETNEARTWLEKESSVAMTVTVADEKVEVTELRRTWVAEHQHGGQGRVEPRLGRVVELLIQQVDRQVPVPVIFGGRMEQSSVSSCSQNSLISWPRSPGRSRACRSGCAYT